MRAHLRRRLRSRRWADDAAPAGSETIVLAETDAQEQQDDDGGNHDDDDDGGKEDDDDDAGAGAWPLGRGSGDVQEGPAPRWASRATHGSYESYQNWLKSSERDPAI